jgi:hypothetical protein
MTATITLPKTAQTFVDDAKAVGATVRVDVYGEQVEINATRKIGETWEASVTLNWAVQNVAPNNSRLGFPTTYKPGMRFWFGSAMVKSSGSYSYPQVKSVRAGRAALGLPI